ncbi:hypothetical protein FOFC_18494 [Fusarium oxysporum]|nr:hypothetical protein FOFC_18494 [Fusarium oxysporum]
MPAIRIVKQKNRYNVDEVGMMEGIGMNGLFLGHRHKKSVLIRQPGSRAWITILECISATGKVLRPTVIFKGKTVQQQHFPEDLDFLDDWEFSCSEKGWTSNKLALIWLRKVFIPSTQPEKKNEPRLLILDGHGSHMTEKFLWECYDNNIYLLFLPPHSSHVLQPLDVAIFGPLKRAYRRLLLDFASVADDSHIGKITFLYTYDKARREAITKSNAIAGFKATGLWPVNLAKVLMNPMVTETPSPAVTANSPAKEQDSSLLKTPRSSIQLRRALEHIPASTTQDPTVRLLFRKIGSQLDCHNLEIEKQNREITILQRENEENRPKRRKKVVYNGNAEFAKIPAIKKAREHMWRTLQPERTANRVKKLKLDDLCCPPELSLPRAALHHLLAARSLHGDFAAYHERFDHSDARLVCSCNRRKAPDHIFYCRKVPPRHRMRLAPSPNAAVNLAIGKDFTKYIDLSKDSAFFGKICPRY